MSDVLIPSPKITSANQILFRAHMVGELMDAKDMQGFTDGHIDALVKMFSEQVEGRKEKIKSKYLEKGNEREKDSLTLKSCVELVVFNKNEERLSNEFITAIPDAFRGRSIHDADKTVDMKSSWSLQTFLKSKLKKLDKNYKWQGVEAMALTGAKSHDVTFCLVNGTAAHILKEKTSAKWNYDAIDPDAHEGYRDECKQIEINHIFDFHAFYEENPGFDFHNNIDDLIRHQIPMKKRIHTVTIERNEDEIKAMYERIVVCRNWMNKNLFKTKLIPA